ncbi:MAG: helix-turn-helix transcriptional regulator [Clostridia bacterium]|nr:helix-turn-helix transcriptional regulator [Clostridia bacterium]MDE7348120.1 helix-turn-helix transcriptional regulator [Clostridia bacterium]
MVELLELSIILKELRERHGYTQRYVAEMLGLRYQSYQAYERGLSVPTLAHFIKLADIYDVSLDYLIGRDKI